MTPDGKDDRFAFAAATPSQIDELVRLDLVCFGALAWGVRAWREVVSDPEWTTVTWCPDGRVRGAMVLLLSRPEASLASLAVHPTHRRNGVGRAFVSEALRQARNAGARWISLEVDRDNAAALALYRSTSFGAHRRFSEDGRQRLEMRRRLRQ